MSQPLRWIALALPTMLLLACGGKKIESTPPTSAEGKEATCASYCAELDSCDLIANEGCSKDCTESNAVSRSGQEVLTDCFSAELCDENVGELTTSLAGACIIEGLSEIELGSTGTEYCNKTVPAINACLGEPSIGGIPVACEDLIGLSSDEYLEGLNSCASQSCDAMEICLYLQVLTSIPPDTVEALSNGDTDSLTSSVLGDLMAAGVALMQLGLVDDLGVDFEDITDGFGDVEDAPAPTEQRPL